MQVTVSEGSLPSRTGLAGREQIVEDNPFPRLLPLCLTLFYGSSRCPFVSDAFLHIFPAASLPALTLLPHPSSGPRSSPPSWSGLCSSGDDGGVPTVLLLILSILSTNIVSPELKLNHLLTHVLDLPPRLCSGPPGPLS